MADVTVRAATAANGGTVTALASQAGDVLLAVVGASGTDAGSAAASGWTMAASDSASFSHAILWKAAGASEPGSYTFTGPSSFGVTVAALAGADTSAPFDVAPVFASGSTGQAASPSVDVATAGALFVCGVAQLYSAPSAPSGMSALGPGYAISYSDYYGEFYQEGMQPGPTGAKNFKSSVFPWGAYALAIRPGSGDGGGNNDGGGGTDLRKNWCTNPFTYQKVPDGWGVTPSTLSAVATDVVGFSRPYGVVAECTATGLTNVSSPLTSASEGETWSTYAQASTSRPMRLALFLSFLDSQGSYLSGNPGVYVDLDTTPSFWKVEGKPAPAGTASVLCNIQDLDATDHMQVGDTLTMTCVDLEEAASIPSYGDGNTPGWVWDGATGLSTSHQVGSAARQLTSSGAGAGSGTVQLVAQPDLTLTGAAAAATGVGAGALTTGRQVGSSGAGSGAGRGALKVEPVATVAGTGAGSGTGVGVLIYGDIIVPTGAGTGTGTGQLTTDRGLSARGAAGGAGRGLVSTSTSRRPTTTGAGTGTGAALLFTARGIATGAGIAAGAAATVLSTGRALSSVAAEKGTGSGRITGLVVVEVAGLRPTVGLSIRLIAADGGAGEYAPDWASIQFTAVHNQGGAVTIDYAKRGINAGLLLADRAEGALFDGDREIPATRFLVTQQSRDAVTEDATTATLNAPLWVPASLGKAVVYPPNWPDATPSKNRFATATPGNIMGTLIQRAQNRGAITNLLTDFDSAVDSNGEPWTYQLNIELDAGQSYGKVLATLVEMGVVDWTCHGRTLRMVNPGTLGTDRTTQAEPVILTAGRDLLDAPEKRDAGTQLTAVLVKGDDGVWVEEVDPNATERLEGYTSQSGVADAGTLQVIGETTLAQSADPKRELTHGLALMDPSGAQPWVDYTVADTVYRDVLGDLQSLRVVQLSATYSPDGMLAGQITLGGKFDSAEVQLTRQMQALTGGSQGSTAPATNEVDTVPPLAPTGLQLTSAAYVDDTGATVAAVTADWLDVLEETDGSPVELDRYVVQWRRLDDTGWSTAGSSRDSDLSWSPMPPGLQIEATVYAVDRNGNQSELAPIVQHVCAHDTVPPPVPTAATVTAYLGQLKAIWDGQGLDGGSPVPMPPDFRRSIVYASKHADFAQADRVDNLAAAGTSVLTDLEYGATYYVWLVAEDVTGNQSAPSAVASGIPRAVGLQDITFKDRGNEIEDGSFERADMRAQREGGPWSFAQDATAPHGGWVLVADATVEPGTHRELFLTPMVPVASADQEFYARYTVRSEDTNSDSTPDTDGAVQLRVVYYDDAGNVFAYASAERAPGVDWMTEHVVATGEHNGQQAAHMRISVTLLDTATTGRWHIDACEVRERVGTLLVQDLAVTNAKIADLEVGKLTAGTLNADVLLAGRISTATTGSRVEIDAAGIRTFNSGNDSVFSYDISNEKLSMVGTLQTGRSGSRIVFSGEGNDIRFYPQSGETRWGRLYSYIPANYPNDIAVEARAIETGSSDYVARWYLLPDRLGVQVMPQGRDTSTKSGLTVDPDFVGCEVNDDSGLNRDGGFLGLNRGTSSGAYFGVSTSTVESYVKVDGEDIYLFRNNISALNTVFDGIEIWQSMFCERAASIGNHALQIATNSGGDVHYYWLDDGSLNLGHPDGTWIKTFVIDHPADPARHLVHATTESPHAGVEYWGIATLEDGQAIVELPDYFEALTREDGRLVQLTELAGDAAQERADLDRLRDPTVQAPGAETPAQSGGSVVSLPSRLQATYPRDGRFTIYARGPAGGAAQVMWLVKAIRNDVPPLEVEPLRSAVDVAGDGPYRYVARSRSSA